MNRSDMHDTNNRPARTCLGALLMVIGVSACSGGVSTTPVTPLPSTSSPIVNGTRPTSTPAASTTPSAAPAVTAEPAASPASSPSPVPTQTPAAVPSANALAIDTGDSADPNYGQYTLPFGQAGGSTTLTLAPAYATFSMALDQATCGSGASAVVSIVQSSPNSFVVTSNAAGICEATITSPGATSTPLWFTVNQTGFTVH